MGDAVAWKMMSAPRVDLPGSRGPVGGAAALSARPFLSGGVRTILLRIRCWFGVNATWC